MAQATSFGKNVINLREWLSAKAKAAPKSKHYISYDERNERRVDMTLESVTAALNKVHNADPDQRPDPRTP
jgi:hypothetical protein